MNEMLEKIAAIDPDYVKRYRRQTRLLVLAVGGAIAAIAAVVILGLYSDATYVQKSACSKDPASEACAELRLEVAKAEPLRNPCTSFQRVTSRRGRNCERFYVDRIIDSAPSAPLHRGGDALQPGPNPGHQPPGPRGGGQQGDSSELPPASAPGGATPETPPASTGRPAGGTPAVAGVSPPARGAAEEIAGDVSGVVDQVTDDVAETGEEVGAVVDATTCRTTPLLCTK